MNGQLPDGAELLSLALLIERTTVAVRLPDASRRLGREIYVTIRPIRKAEYLAMVPPPPPESIGWPEGESIMDRAARWQRWLDGLPPELRADRQAAQLAVSVRLVAAGLVEPALTMQEVERLGDDVDTVAVEILRLSGLLPDQTPEESPPVAEVPAA